MLRASEGSSNRWSGNRTLIALTVGALVLAVAAGIGLKYAPSSRDAEKQTGGADVLEVLGTTALIAGLLIGFVLSGASTSYSSASTAARAEADTVETLYESAEFVKQPYRQRLQVAAVCYARAVARPGFAALAFASGR